MKVTTPIDRLRMSNLLALLGAIGCLNFWMAAFTGLYDRFGLTASLDIGIGSLIIAFILGVTAICFKKRSGLAWFLFIVTLVSIGLLLAFVLSFKFKM